MRAKTQVSAVHGTTGWPGALRGPDAQMFTVTSVAAVRDRSDAHIGPAGFARSVYGWLPEGPDESCGAARRVVWTLVWGITARLDHCCRRLQPTAPDYREGDAALLCPCPRYCGDTEGGPVVSCNPDRWTRVRLQSGLVAVDGLGARDAAGKPGPYSSRRWHAATERRRSHLRQWPRGLRTLRSILSSARAHRNNGSARWEARLPSGLLNGNRREERNDQYRRPSAAQGGG